jgi:hypothetical protein
LSSGAQQVEDLYGRLVGGAEPVGQAGVELGGFPWLQDQVVIVHDEP